MKDNNSHVSLVIENKKFEDLNPLTFGYQHCEPLHSFTYTNFQHYLIHYVVSGKGSVNAYGKEYSVSKGEMFMIKKSETVSYSADSKVPWHYIWISFDGKLAKRFDDLGDRIYTLNSDVFIRMLKCLEMQSMREEYLAAMLFILYREIFADKESENYIAKVANFIEMNYMQKINFEEIAKNLFISRKHLSKIFKSETGVTMQEYLMDIRMKSAVKLLTEGHNVSETARLVSYDDQFVFSKAFKKFFGYSPSGIKKNNFRK